MPDITKLFEQMKRKSDNEIVAAIRSTKSLRIGEYICAAGLAVLDERNPELSKELQKEVYTIR